MYVITYPYSTGSVIDCLIQRLPFLVVFLSTITDYNMVSGWGGLDKIAEIM